MVRETTFEAVPHVAKVGAGSPSDTEKIQPLSPVKMLSMLTLVPSPRCARSALPQIPGEVAAASSGQQPLLPIGNTVRIERFQMIRTLHIRRFLGDAVCLLSLLRDMSGAMDETSPVDTSKTRLVHHGTIARALPPRESRPPPHAASFGSHPHATLLWHALCRLTCRFKPPANGTQNQIDRRTTDEIDNGSCSW
jgi:hypothetical protein